MKRFGYLLFVAILISVSCRKEEILLQTASQRSSVVISDENGKEIKDGDTIVIDEHLSHFKRTQITVKGLLSNEVYTVSSLVNETTVRTESSIFYYTGYSNMYPYEGEEKIHRNGESVTYIFQTLNYFSIYKPVNKLKIEFSDGSEYWMINPIKMVVDTTGHHAKISLNCNDLKNMEITDGLSFSLNAGENVWFTAWAENLGLPSLYYFRIVSSTFYQDGTAYNTIIDQDRNDIIRYIDSNTRHFQIGYKPWAVKQEVSVQLLGSYCASNTIKFGINYK